MLVPWQLGLEKCEEGKVLYNTNWTPIIGRTEDGDEGKREWTIFLCPLYCQLVRKKGSSTLRKSLKSAGCCCLLRKKEGEQPAGLIAAQCPPMLMTPVNNPVRDGAEEGTHAGRHRHTHRSARSVNGTESH